MQNVGPVRLYSPPRGSGVHRDVGTKTTHVGCTDESVQPRITDTEKTRLQRTTTTVILRPHGHGWGKGTEVNRNGLPLRETTQRRTRKV